MNDRHRILEDDAFWVALEYGLCGWFRECEDPALRGYWCDGVVPHQARDTRDGVEITGNAWIVDGRQVERSFAFVAAIPQRMLHRRRAQVDLRDVDVDVARGTLRFAVQPGASDEERRDARSRPSCVPMIGGAMCDAVVSIAPVECGLPWPSGHHVEIASIDVAAHVIEDRLGRPLRTGVEDGLGPWKADGFRLSTGEWMELISYEGDVEPCFILRVDAGTPAEAAIARCLAAFGLRETYIRWRVDAG